MNESEIERCGKKIKFNIADYGYFDSLKLEGWMWEFISRSKEYRDLFSEIEEYFLKHGKFLAKKMTTSGNKHIDNFLIKKVLQLGRTSFIKPSLTKQALSTQNYFSARITAWSSFVNIPRPKVAYKEFTDEKPIIIGATFVRSHKIDEVILSEFRKNKKDKNSRATYFEYCYDMINDMLPIRLPEDTLFVGIAMTGKKRDIMEDLDKLIKNKIKSSDERSRREDKKWKYYLMVYDLKNKYDSLTYSDIALTISTFYKERRGEKWIDDLYDNLSDERNIRNYWNRANDLISGGYKHYVV